MDNIVVAIEFDEELDDVINFTGDLIKDESIGIHVVHAYQSRSELVDYAPYMVNAIEDYEKHLEKQAESVMKLAGRLGERGLQAHGYMKPIDKNVVESILEFAKEKKAQLIVVGTHHPNRIERMMLGSVTEKLIRQSEIPVAVVPRKV